MTVNDGKNLLFDEWTSVFISNARKIQQKDVSITQFGGRQRAGNDLVGSWLWIPVEH